MIARLYPSTPKFEMFARGPRAGFDVWGNAAEQVSRAETGDR